MRKKKAVLAVSILLMACTQVSVSQAQQSSTYWKPSQSIEIVAPAGAGGSIDIAARTLQRFLQDQKLISTPVLVINKPGGGNIVGTTYFAQFKGNPHFLGMLSNTILSNQIMGRTNIGYQDITPISLLFSEYVLFVVRADSKLKSGRDLITQLKRDPQSLSLSLPVLGGAFHLAFASAVKASGGDIKRLKVVVFNSAADSIAALVGGHVDVVASTPSSAASQFASGSVRVLAVSAPTRLKGAFASVPTWKEQGVASEMGTFRFVGGTSGLAENQIAFWERALLRLSELQEWHDYAEKNHYSIDHRNSRATIEFLDSQYKVLYNILSELGMTK